MATGQVGQFVLLSLAEQTPRTTTPMDQLPLEHTHAHTRTHTHKHTHTHTQTQTHTHTHTHKHTCRDQPPHDRTTWVKKEIAPTPGCHGRWVLFLFVWTISYCLPMTADWKLSSPRNTSWQLAVRMRLEKTAGAILALTQHRKLTVVSQWAAPSSSVCVCRVHKGHTIHNSEVKQPCLQPKLQTLHWLQNPLHRKFKTIKPWFLVNFVQ